MSEEPDREPHQDTAPLAFLDSYLRDVVAATGHVDAAERLRIWILLQTAANEVMQ